MNNKRAQQIRERLEAATIPGFPDYEVHSDGSVWSLTNWRGYGSRRLVPVAGKDGYFKVRLISPDGRRTNHAVHRLVASAFLPPRELGQQVRHLNGVKTDNRSVNLAWGSAAQNAADRERHGTTARGSANGSAVLSPAEVRSIRAMSIDGMRQRDIASVFGVSQRTVWRVIHREVWGHVA